MSEELKPCPFCGDDEAYFEGEYPAPDTSEWGAVHCADCCAIGPYAPTQAEAIADWNRRAQPEPAAPTALQRFNECDGDTETDPLERLRFFCSLAMRGQDWLDVEPFFDAVKAAAPTVVEPDVPETACWNRRPVAWLSTDCIGERYLCFTKPLDKDPVTPLYAHPPRTPLTDKEIHDCFQYKSRDKTEERRLITRAVERAHGITEGGAT